MKHFYLIALWVALLSGLPITQALAQTNFQPGYVLPPIGDTLRGEIDFREGRLNAQSCHFRTNASAEVVTYQPEQLRGYGLTTRNRHYRTIAVAVEENATSKPYFLEVLVGGPASLYFLRMPNQREEYFVGLPNQPLAILRHGMVQQAQGMNEAKMVIDRRYRNTLQAVLANCPVVERKLRNLPFHENALIDIINTYNGECIGYRPHAKSSAVTSHFAVSLVAGAALHNVTYEGFPFKNDVTLKNTSVGFAFGPMVRYSSERVSQRISLVAALLYEPEKYEIGPDKGSNAGSDTRIHFDLAYLRLPLMVRYTYPRGKVVPIAEVGLTAAYAVKADITSGTFINGQYTVHPGAITNILTNVYRSSQIGLGAGIGVSTHAVGGHAVALLVRAERTNGFVDDFISTATLHIYGLLTFDLTK
jgi:hypothetical protein